MDQLDKLYQNYDILAAADSKPSEHEAEYLEIIQSVKGEPKEKMLACQFISRFMKDFPHLAETALDAVLDIVDDQDIGIRKQAVKVLPNFCKEYKESIPKVVDVLAQLLQFEDAAEVNNVQNVIMSIFKMDVLATFEGLMSQISMGEEEKVRKRTIHFLVAKFKFVPAEMVTKEVEERVLEISREVLPKLPSEHFLTLIPFLANLKIAKMLPVQQALVGIISDHADLTAEFQASEDSVLKLIECVRLAQSYFSPFVHSTAFFNYLCQSVLPKLDDIQQLEEGKDLCLDVIKMVAEISPFVDLDNLAKDSAELIHDRLLEHLPLPPTADLENFVQPETPNIQFTHIESLLYAFINILKHNPEFLTAPDNTQRFKDLKTRLHYMARGVQNTIKQLRESLAPGKSTDVKPEDMKVKALALRTLNNINVLVKDLVRVPPSFKTTISLSWKPITVGAAKTSAAIGGKRESDSDAAADRKHPRREPIRGNREIYIPPSGKYSTNVNSYSNRGRGGSGYYRGRGRRFY